jgi:hypothetical protein
MRRSIVVTIALILAASGGRAAVDARTQFGATRASLLEAITANVYGGHLEWTPLPTLVAADGTRRTIAVGGLTIRNEAGGYTCAVSIEFPDTAVPILTALQRFEAPAGQSQPDIIAFKTTKAFAVTAVHRGTLGDSAAAVARVDDVDFTSLSYDAVWPEVYVTYTGSYGTSEWLGEIAWESKLSTDPVAPMGRVPTRLLRTDKNGQTKQDEAVAGARDEDTITVSSKSSHQLVATCTDPCLLDGKTLLALWWPAPAVVAVTP